MFSVGRIKETGIISWLILISIIHANAQFTETYSDVKPAIDFTRNWTKSSSLKAADNSLSYNIRFIRFNLQLDPAIQYIQGSVTHYFTYTSDGVTTMKFSLSPELTIDSVVNKGKKLQLARNGDDVMVQLASASSKGQLDSIRFYYRGSPPIGKENAFTASTHAGKPVIYTLSEPYGSHEWWPCKEGLTDKADSIEMIAIVPSGNRVAGNGILLQDAPYGSNQRIFHWKHRYPVAPYLVAIAVTNYAAFTDWYKRSSDSLPVLNYVYPEDSAYLRTQAALVLPVLQLYEGLFGKYPFSKEKYGHAQFGWSGGMEHQTMTYLSRNAFTHEIIAHELAHQWFGDMVTCGSWHDIWLNEGFATFCSGLTYERMFNGYWWPRWKTIQISQTVALPDGSVYCDDTTSVNRIFSNRLTYVKGGMLLHMLRWVMGDDAFFRALNNYLDDPSLKYGFARETDMQRHLEATFGKSLQWFFDQWYYGQGYPSYSITYTQRSDNRTVVILGQTQSNSSANLFTMPVPLRFWGGGKDTLAVLNQTENNQKFLLKLSFPIDSVQFDPDQWLVSAHNKTTKLLLTESNPKISVYPNPSRDHFTIDSYFENIISINFYDMTGRQVGVNWSENSPGQAMIYLENIPAGTYILRIKTDEREAVQKVIVIK